MKKGKKEGRQEEEKREGKKEGKKEIRKEGKNLHLGRTLLLYPFCSEDLHLVYD